LGCFDTGYNGEPVRKIKKIFGFGLQSTHDKHCRIYGTSELATGEDDSHVSHVCNDEDADTRAAAIAALNDPENGCVGQ